MTDPKPEPAKESPQLLHEKARYRAPKLEILGSLRSATRGTAGGSADGSTGMDGSPSMMASDRRAKEDIVKVGQHPLGLGIYLFRYKAPFSELYGTGRHIGVMADEVAEKYSDAVCRDEHGYLMVDYGRLFGRSPMSDLPSVAAACDNPTHLLQRATHDGPQA